MSDSDKMERLDDGVSKESDLYQKPPSMFQMLRTFSKDVIKYVASGSPNVSAEDYADRLDACSTCPHLNKEVMRCGLCGCLVEHKAKWKTTACPDKPMRWKIQISDPKTVQPNDKK